MVQERTKFETEWKSSTFLLEIMTLLSPANNTYPDIEFILRGRLFIYLYIYIYIYIMSNRGARIDP